MLGSTLNEPVLVVALDAVGKIQGGEEAVGGLWSVFTKVKDSVIDGHRLENMSWRLWYRARVTPKLRLTNSLANGLPRYADILPRPLSSPSLSFSSSSEGTGASSDWDRDTAVGEDDDSQCPLIYGARRNPAVSPHSEKPHLVLASGARLAQAPTGRLPSPAPSSCRCHQSDSSQDAARVRLSPSAHSDSTPHQPATDAEADTCRENTQGVSFSGSLHHSLNPAQSIAGLEAPSPSPHDSISSRTFPAQHSAITSARSTTASKLSNNSLFATQVLAATITSSSMPISLPSTDSHRQALPVGRIIAELFPAKMPTRERHGSERRTPAPIIVEPMPSTPPVTANTSSWIHLGSSPSPAPNSAATSATSTPRQAFPTVVVVNPTPHPTPPATPSPGVSDAPSGLRPFSTPITRDPADKHSDAWSNESENEQLATPVSVNGEARSVSFGEPIFVMVEPRTQHLQESRSHTLNVTALPLQTPLLSAAAIALPEKPTDPHTSSHLPTPSSESSLQTSEMAPPVKSTTSPIPAPVPSDDKKFFLAAPHNGSGGSGQGSSESPDSLGTSSVSPEKASHLGLGRVGDMVPTGSLLVARDAASEANRPQEQLIYEEDPASSFSASSPPGRAPSVTSSRGGSSLSSRFKLRGGFSVASGSRRKQGSKKITLIAGRGQTIGADAEVKLTHVTELKAREQEDRTRAKGKEKESAERNQFFASGASTEQVVPLVGPQPQPYHRQQPQQSQQLRQLPTNPPRQQAHRLPADVPRPNPAPPLNTRQLPCHPQLGPLGLGHLPTVPPRQRRPIEITETSSEYETTDTDGDESSWESDSGSGDEDGEGDSHPKPSRERPESSAKNAKTSGVAANNRTRGAGEFARDAALEAQRQRELFQKLPARSYSHLGQLPRTKSGLSMLFRPDPALFPEGHPYRTSHSSHDILARNWSAPAPPLAMAAVSRRGAAVGPMQATINAAPVVSSVNSRPVTAVGSGARRLSSPQRGGYRPRGKPEGQEEETDSGDEDPEDAIQVSSSVAQKRLAALLGPRPAQQRPAPTQPSISHPEVPTQSSRPQPVSRTITAPVLMHPYLPDPAPLQTPHTVRRNIISQELDEELRRNLLWERSQNQIQGRPPRAAGSILPGPWRPLTVLKQEDTRETQSNTSDKAPGKRPFATQRTKSWAGDYHASGW